MDDRERLDIVAASFDQLPMLMAVTRGDDHRLVTLNAFGRAAIGDRPVDEPIATWLDDLVDQELLERYAEAWRTGEPVVGHEWPVQAVGADGRPYVGVFDLTLSPVRDDDGAVCAVVCLGHDVTQQVRARRSKETRSAAMEKRYLAAREVVAELQDAVLPKGLPVPQGVELSARYLLAGDGVGAGGDWFDAVPLPDGRVVVVVGDVVGHGIEASVVMGELKTLFEETVRSGGDLVAALELLDGRARRVPQARATTLCAGLYDPRSGVLEYVTAGHPPPVLAGPGGEARYLTATGAGPLGSGLPFGTARYQLSEGDVLVLYSDGLVERPGRSLVQNTVDLLRAVGVTVRGPAPGGEAGEQVVERVCRQTLELLTRVSGYADDISILALQAVPPRAPLELRLPAVPDTLRVVRADLDDWLADLRVSPVDRTAVQHAVGELVSNAVEHAYAAPGVTDAIHVAVRLTPDGVLDLTVADEGRWRQPTVDPRGRGLSMVHGFLDEFELDHDDHGTRARGRHRVSHPASLLRGSTPVHQASHRAAPTVEADDGVVRVCGPVDFATADLLRAVVARASLGGIRPARIDLGEVELLCSAAVQVLYDARRAGSVELVAPMGSPAQHVLDLVGLPYLTTGDR